MQGIFVFFSGADFREDLIFINIRIIYHDVPLQVLVCLLFFRTNIFLFLHRKVLNLFTKKSECVDSSFFKITLVFIS